MHWVVFGNRSFKKLNILYFLDFEDAIYFKVLLIGRLIIQFQNSWGWQAPTFNMHIDCKLHLNFRNKEILRSTHVLEGRKKWSLFSQNKNKNKQQQKKKHYWPCIHTYCPLIPWPLLPNWELYCPDTPAYQIFISESPIMIDNDRIFILQLSDWPKETNCIFFSSFRCIKQHSD